MYLAPTINKKSPRAPSASTSRHLVHQSEEYSVPTSVKRQVYIGLRHALKLQGVDETQELRKNNLVFANFFVLAWVLIRRQIESKN